ncbi:unnamed protein product [Rotaria magnacalcarata]|uniref:Uncharacterized protein n=2 Tax=Rotaria magnacalcarata TaxID=392030 RepID=A0A817A7J2_9BILA|nr:unnamed protein product [Rotaria magnacalcarata]CAF4207264.1 unnamed protein product [Rotaria magnacalcarata]
MLPMFSPLALPDNVLSFEGEKFFELVNQTCGEIFKELMEVLSINTVHKLLLLENDILAVFQKKYKELEKITQRACLHLDDDTIMLKPGLRLDYDRFIEALHAVNNQSRDQEQTVSLNDVFFSLLKNLTKSFQLNENDDSQNSYCFLIAFIENIFSNLLKNKNNYRYSEAVMHFAQSLYILGGRNVYEFVRLNLPGAIPSMPTLNESLGKAGACIEEGEFRYNVLHDHQKSYGYQIAVCSEDATAVIKKVTYNAATNTFTGFSLPLERGIPVARYFQTDSFDELKNWFENKDKTDYLNVHMVQPLIASSPYSSPFLLAAYGISNNFKAIDVLNRWIWMFEKSKQSNVRIVAFSTDCDPRYLLAMRLATSFFAKFVNISLCDRKDVLEIDLPKDWSAWFFMQTRQVFFCFQDPIHLCTKLRNRMLSKKATMLIGNEVVSIEVLMKLIETKSKLVHGLVKTDIEPKDRQNFKACIKLSNDDVLAALEDIDGSQATRVYLRLLRSVVLAYVEHNTSIIDRIYHSWFSVFLCRIWQTWLQIIDEKDILGYRVETKKNLFITGPALFSIELNAHSLLAVCLLVCQHKLPESALSISNYSSQPCEATFRLTRSMSGAFSSVVNFTTDQFLKRAGKLSVLTDLENQSESGQLGCPLQFPKHHKRRRKVAALKKSVSNTTIDLPRNDTIKKIIHQAYNDAYKLLSELDINIALEKKKKTKINEVSSYVRTQFEKKFKKVTYDEGEIYSSNDESDEEVATNVNSSSKPEEDSSEDENDLPCISSSGKHQFNGMRVTDTISSSLTNSYFCVEIDNKKKYIHKQTACWLLTDNKANLSADRLKRVQQGSR